MRDRTHGRVITAGCLALTLTWTAGCGERSGPSSTATPRETVSKRVSPPPPAAPTTPAPEPSSVPAPETRVQRYDSSTLESLSEEDATYRPHEPIVLLSTQHAETCLLKVDETFPDVTLQTLEGEPDRLLAHLGERLTVVVFWDGQHPLAIDQIRRLEADVADPYSAVGLRVIAIHVGDSTEQQRTLLSQVQPKYLVLQDPGRQAYSQIATDLMPRTYLLDSQGRVLWLDVEYSRSFRRELRNAILYHLRPHREAVRHPARPIVSAEEQDPLR